MNWPLECPNMALQLCMIGLDRPLPKKVKLQRARGTLLNITILLESSYLVWVMKRVSASGAFRICASSWLVL